MREIPQRELRNDISRVLREVEAGETVLVTVRGKVVAQLSPPPPRKQTFVPWDVARELFPPDPEWAEELRRMREEEEDWVDPWERSGG